MNEEIMKTQVHESKEDERENHDENSFHPLRDISSKKDVVRRPHIREQMRLYRDIGLKVNIPDFEREA